MKISPKFIINLFIAVVWLINGLFCKLLDFTPRHREIVARILASDRSAEVTSIIGIFEIAMAVWILSRFRSRLNAVTQIIIITAMNILEFIFASDLLLWGKCNIIFAFIFIIFIYCNEFRPVKQNMY